MQLFNDYLLVTPIPRDVSAGGIVTGDFIKHDLLRCKVDQVGPGRQMIVHDKITVLPMRTKVGDVVLFREGAAKLEFGKKQFIIAEDSLIGIE